MVGAVGDTGVVDTLEARLENVRRMHEANEYGNLPWVVVKAGLHSMWATEHPSRPASPRPVTNEGSVDVGVNAGGGQVGSSAGGTSRQRGVIHADEVSGIHTRGMQSSGAAGSSRGDVRGRRSGLSPMLATQVTAGGIAPSYGYFKFTPDRILVTSPRVGRPDILTWKEAIEHQLEMAGLIGFARGTVATPEEHHADLRAEFRAVQLLTFTVISRCCSPGVQIALKWCREYLDASHRAWHFIESTYQVTDDLFIAQLEGQLTHMRMGDEETATDYCNRARRILATIKMAGAQYSTASYVTHEMQGLTSSYNLLKRLTMAPSTRTMLNEDNLTSYILQDEAMQEAEQSEELLAQANFVAPAKQGGRPGQRGPSGGGGSSGWKPTKEVDKKKSTKKSGRGGGGRRRECWLCGDPDHLSFECANRSDSDDDDAKGGRGRSSRAARQGEDRKQVLIPNVLYVPGVRANLLSSGQLKEYGVKLQEDGDEMLLISAAGEVLGRATYSGRVLCTDMRPCSTRSMSPTPEVVALRAIVSKTKSTPDRVHARVAHVGMDNIRSSAKHEVATRLDLESAAGADSPCVSCAGRQEVGCAAGVLEVAGVGGEADEEFGADASLRPRREVPREEVHRLRGRQGDRPRLDLPVHPSAEWNGGVGDADGGGVGADDAIAHGRAAPLVAPRSAAGGLLGPASGRTPTTPPTDTSTGSLPLLAEVGEPTAEDVADVPSPFPSPDPPAPPLVANLRGLAPMSASGDEGSRGTSPPAPAKGIAGGRRDKRQVNEGGKSTGEEQVEEEQPTWVKSAKQAAVQQPTGEQAAVTPTTEHSATRQSAEEPTTEERSARKSTKVQQDDEGSEAGLLRRPPDFFIPAAFTTVYDEEDEEFPELDPDLHADPELRWDISTMTVKEALASWKGLANRWVFTTKYHVDDTIEHEKARLVVKGFTQMYGADYNETFVPVGSYVMLQIFLSIVTVLNLNLMQLDMKNAFLHSKLDRVLYMSPSDYFNDGTGWVCKLLKSLYGLKQSPLLWYLALNDVLVGAGWKKSQVDEALYFKVGDDGAACWVLVYVDDLLAASSSTEMLKELKELLASTFKLREISPVQKYLGLEIVRDRSAGKLWLHQQGYADKLRRRFIDEEQTRHTPKMPVSVDDYAELTFDDEEAQERQEEEYRQKFGSLQFAATTTRPNITFACSKLGSGVTVRSDQHWREVDRCLAYLANTRDTALEFGGGPESLELVGYVDTDDAGDKQNQTCTSSYVFVYGGAAVSWSSQRIKCATLSSTESEYVVVTEADKEGRRLRFLLAEFRQLDAGKPTDLRVDNKSAITVAEGMGLTGNLIHMERRQAWLQHMVKSGKFSLRYISTAEQPADFLTKALHYAAFNRCSVAIGHVRLADVGDGDDEVQQ
ncbi:unnamed protein product [Closterium sp. NIES-54]